MNRRIPVVSRLHAKLALDAGRLFIRFVRNRDSVWESTKVTHNAKHDLLPPNGGWMEEDVLDVATGDTDKWNHKWMDIYEITVWIEVEAKNEEQI